MNAHRLLLVALPVSLLLSAGSARADEVARRDGLSLVAGIGAGDGLVAGAGLSTGSLGVRATAGWRPLVISMVEEAGDSPDFGFYSSGQANVDLVALPWQPSPRAAVGASLGYKFNTVLGHGAGAAFEASIGLSPRLSLLLNAGVAYFPDGDDEIREREMASPETDFNYPLGAGWQSGANIGLAFRL